MAQPAARVGDMHICPMVTPGLPPIPHVGGPILPPGVPTVLIGGMPAATVTSQCTCVGPPDIIVKGSMIVLIGGKPAARMGDTTAHGGSVIIGCPTVLIGDVFSLALINALRMIESKLKELETWDENAKENLKKWMGDDSEATRDAVKEKIEKIRDAILDMDETNFQPAEEGEEDCFAYVYPNDSTHTVYIGDDFGPAPNTGTNSKAGTVIHEASHFNDVVGTDDHTYGTTKTQNLASSSPSTAQDNADNFEYYMEH